jgi:putative ABC transport system substrate-binding protein
VLRRDAFRKGLRDLGYIEGKTINIEYRYAEGRSEQLNKLAEELIRLNVNVLVVPNDLTARAAKKATAKIPIVMASSGNPIGTGIIASLARPGGNVTGLTSYTAELLGKRLEVLKEVVPKVSRVAFLNDATRGGASASMAAFTDAQVPATALGVKLQLVEVKTPQPDFASAFRIIATARIGALITSPVFTSFHRKRILQLVEQNRLPAMHPAQEWVNAGGLMSYGANSEDQYRRAATYVDKILKGAKPADLPVEQPTKFELVVNLKTAKQIGLTIPPNVLARADRVIR